MIFTDGGGGGTDVPAATAIVFPRVVVADDASILLAVVERGVAALDLVMAGTATAVTMVEAGANIGKVLLTT